MNKKPTKGEQAAYEDGFEKGVRACGGCKKCWGKGYSTNTGRHGEAYVSSWCACMRGKQAQKYFERYFEL